MIANAITIPDSPAELTAERVSALATWIAAHPDHGLADTVLNETATLAPLHSHDCGPARFDDADFGELARFLAELPW